MKKELPIEKLLQWAYRDELTKNPALLPSGTLQKIYGRWQKFGQYGCYIDESKKPDSSTEYPWQPENAGAPHTDALKLDAAVVALEPDYINWDQDKYYLMRNPDLVDRRLIEDRRVRPASIIITSAQLRKAPDWESYDSKPKKYSTATGKVVVHPAKQSGERNYRLGACCPLFYEPPFTALAWERIDYAVWHASLRKLANDLVDRFESFTPLPPSVPACPWAHETLINPAYVCPVSLESSRAA